MKDRLHFLYRRVKGIDPLVNEVTGDGVTVLKYDWFTDRVLVRWFRHGYLWKGQLKWISREYYLAIEGNFKK